MNAHPRLLEIAEKLAPDFGRSAKDQDDSDRFASEHVALLKEQKIYAALIPAEYGGGGVSHSEMCAFLRRLARENPSTALALAMHQHLVSAAVYNDRHGRPGRKLLDKVVADNAVLVSTGANDWLGSSGSSEKVEGGLRVTARKPFASGSPAGGMLVTSVPHDDPVEGAQVLHFAVPFSAEGVRLAGDWQTMGMRASGSETVILDGVFVPEASISLRRPRSEYHPAFNVILTVAMPLIMSVYMGVAEAAADEARRLVKKRAGSAPDEDSIYLIGELANHEATATLAVDDMVRLADDLGFTASVELASRMLVRKTIAAEAVLATGRKAMEAAGGAGFYRSSGIERLLRDLHGAPLHPMPPKRQHRFTGRLELGLDPIG